MLLMAGVAAGEAGRYDLALPYLERACRTDPDHLPAHQALAYASIEQGRLEEAGAALARALELAPGNRKSLELERKLREARAGGEK